MMLRHRSQGNAEAHEEDPCPTLEAYPFTEEESRSESACNVDKRGCRENETEVRPGKYGHERKEVHHRTGKPGKKILVTDHLPREKQKLSRFYCGDFADLLHSFGEEYIVRRIRENDDRNHDGGL